MHKFVGRLGYLSGICVDEAAITHNFLSLHNHVAGGKGTAKNERRHGIPVSGGLQATDIPDRDVRAHARGQDAAIGAPQNLGATARRQFQRLACRHGVRSVPDALHQHGLARFREQMPLSWRLIHRRRDPL